MSCYQFKTEQEVKEAYVVRILARDKDTGATCHRYICNSATPGCAYGLIVDKVIGYKRQPTFTNSEAYLLVVCFKDNLSAKAFAKDVKKNVRGIRVRSTPMKDQDIRVLNYTPKDNTSQRTQFYRSMGY